MTDNNEVGDTISRLRQTPTDPLPSRSPECPTSVDVARDGAPLFL